MISLNNISKSFSNKSSQQVLKNISLKIQEGHIYGFYGANGSGKTTLFKILSNLLLCDSGTVNFRSKNDQIAYVGNNPRSFINRLSARQNLEFFSTIRTGEKFNVSDDLFNLLEQLNLYKILDKKVSEFSAGQIQKLSLVRSFLYKSNIYIFDETFASIDDSSTEIALNYIKKGLKNNLIKNIIISSHDLNFLKENTDKIFYMEDINN